MATVKPTVPSSPAIPSFHNSNQNTPVKPNPHPYAIRTTSTGLLTRSNSSGHNSATSRHHYVPISSSSTSRKDARRRGHKHTQSLNDSYDEFGSPQPLPVPSSFLNGVRDGHRGSPTPAIPPRRRAETLPPNVTGSILPSGVTSVGDLPPNPKLWTPSQLSSYLFATLGKRDSDAEERLDLPPSTILGIVGFVQSTNMSGRVFLRLNEEDMATMGIDVSWREALLLASRNLRQSVIKGRIWGAGTDSPPQGSHSSPFPSQPFSPLYDSSSSSVELTDDEDVSYAKRRHVRGRVRGMVESFERSGSFSSESGADEVDGGRPDRPVLKQWLAENAMPENAVDDIPSIASPIEATAAREAATSAEEPTVEALLAETESSGTWGARAWEAFDDMGPGVTVKRVSEHGAEDLTPTKAAVVDRGAWMQSLKRGSVAKRQMERRVVTAVFAPAAEEQTTVLLESCPEDEDGVLPLKLHEEVEEIVQTPLSTPELEPDVDLPYRQLEAELQTARALVDMYKKRAEDAELKLTQLEQDESRHVSQVQPVADVQVQTAPSQDVGGEEEEIPGSGTSMQGPATMLVSKLLSVGPAFVPSMLRRALFGRRRPNSRTRANARTQQDTDFDGPSSMSEVPQYVLLVGLGVCAVVLRLMLKKAATRRA